MHKYTKQSNLGYQASVIKMQHGIEGSFTLDSVRCIAATYGPVRRRTAQHPYV